MRTSTMTSVAAIAALFTFAISARPAMAQYPAYGPLPPMSKMKITIEPMLPVGPAIDSDQGGMYGGLQGGFGFYFVDKRFISIGVDGKLGYAVPVVKTWDSYYDHSGSLVTMSFGLPLRFGGQTGFFLRPGLCFEIFNHTVQGYDPVENETWRAEFKGSFAFGACVAFGVDFDITNRVSLGFGMNIDFLLVPHDARTDWYTGTVPLVHNYGTVTGRITLIGFAKLTIGL